MTRPRQELVDLSETPYYHCICRCVRRAFLCGEDHLTGKNYEHRKEWVVERLAQLSKVFALEVAAFAVLSNHYHIVVRVNREQGKAWDDREVAIRWKQLYSIPPLVERYLKGEANAAEADRAQEIIDIWRARLIDLSWYMRSLNEHLARRANEEDKCTGRFWEGRFKSQALLGEGAVLTCMSYVDLNPIRAGIAETPETSDYTSVKQRIEALQSDVSVTNTDNDMLHRDHKKGTQPNKPITVPLMPLIANDDHPQAIGYTTQDYLQLVDWAARAIRSDKRGAISETAPPILARLELDESAFIGHVRAPEKEQTHPIAFGPLKRLKALAQRWRQKFIRNQYYAHTLYRSR